MFRYIIYNNNFKRQKYYFKILVANCGYTFQNYNKNGNEVELVCNDNQSAEQYTYTSNNSYITITSRQMIIPELLCCLKQNL